MVNSFHDRIKLKSSGCWILSYTGDKDNDKTVTKMQGRGRGVKQQEERKKDMNDQCMRCKIRKFCSRPEPFIDGTCGDFVEEGTYVKWMDGPKQDAEPVASFDPGAPEGDQTNVRLDWGERGPEIINIMSEKQLKDGPLVETARAVMKQITRLDYAIAGVRSKISSIGIKFTDKDLNRDEIAFMVGQLNALQVDLFDLEEEREKKLRGTADGREKNSSS